MKKILIKVILPSTLTSTGDMAEWCRDNGIPVMNVIPTHYEGWVQRFMPRNNRYIGSSRMVVRRDELVPNLRRLIPRRGEKMLLVMIRADDEIVFRIRFKTEPSDLSRLT